MANIMLANNRVVGDYERPYIIAEVNSSHNGNVEIAKKMIDEAREAGCDCVKFQSWSSESLYSKSYYKQNPIAKRFVDKFSLSEDELLEIIDYCREKEIDFSSTPYSEREVDFLAENKVPFIKIASMELNNLEFIRYIANKNIPIILSTGMGDYEEIKKAVETIKETGNTKLVLLHCVSIYPAKDETVNLKNIEGLRELCPGYPVGFSDHTLGDSIAIAAVALGASVIEKHITLDKEKIGMDNQMAMEPDELKVLVSKCITVNKALGGRERKILPEEYEQRKNMRRSIVTSRSMKKNEVISKIDICYKRPGTGISPDMVSEVIGKTILNDIEDDELIFFEDIK